MYMRQSVSLLGIFLLVFGTTTTNGGTPADAGAVAGNTGSVTCDSLIDLGYVLQYGQHTYRVKSSGAVAPINGPLFFDETGKQIIGMGLPEQVVAAAWVKSMIVDRYNVSNESGQARGFSVTYSNLRGWQDAEDLLARVTVETVEAAASGGQSAEQGVVNLTTNELTSEFSDPGKVLAHFVHAALQSSLQDYGELEAKMRSLNRASPNVSDLSAIWGLYEKAHGTSSLAEAVGASVVPLSRVDVLNDYFASARGEIGGGTPVSVAVNVLDLINFFAKSSAAMEQSLKVNIELHTSDLNVIRGWATESGVGCSSSTAPTPGTKQSTAPTTATGGATSTAVTSGSSTSLQIRSISPTSVRANETSTVTITGAGFRAGMNVSLVTPTGTVNIPAAMVVVTSASEARVTLTVPGTAGYSAKIEVSAWNASPVAADLMVTASGTNSTGTASAGTPAKSTAPAVTTLKITSMTPSQVRAGQPSVLTLLGSGFQNGLSISVAGGAGISSLNVSAVTANGIVVRVTMRTPGPYSAQVVVRNPSGQAASAVLLVTK